MNTWVFYPHLKIYQSISDKESKLPAYKPQYQWHKPTPWNCFLVIELAAERIGQEIVDLMSSSVIVIYCDATAAFRAKEEAP